MRLQDIRYAILALALAAPACGRTGDTTSAVNQRDTAATERATHQTNGGAPDTRDTDTSRRNEGSTGTAGSVARSPEEAMGVGPDAAITMKIQAKYADDDVVKGRNIDVDTANGIVTLKGEVDSMRERDAAEQLARETSGVKRVVNQLKVAAR
jgi:hyperosmotically inducible protein